MESNKKAQLLEKYWKGTASLSEEKELLEQFDSIEELEETEAAYFQQIKQFSELSLGKVFNKVILKEIEKEEITLVRRLIPAFYWKIAAAILFCVSLTVLYSTYQKIEASPLLAVENDPEKAFELTKQALLLVSSKLNEGAEFTAALDKFSEMQEKIKNRD